MGEMRGMANRFCATMPEAWGSVSHEPAPPADRAPARFLPSCQARRLRSARGRENFAGKEQKGGRYHKAILALGTAFWDAHLKGDKAAKKWLKGAGAKSVLQKQDNWESNKLAG